MKYSVYQSGKAKTGMGEFDVELFGGIKKIATGLSNDEANKLVGDLASSYIGMVFWVELEIIPS